MKILHATSLQRLSGWLASVACGIALTACGGGGGSPGQTNNGSGQPTPAKVELVSSAPTISASGLDGTEVTLTAVVKDANNNVMVNSTVEFTADSGSVSRTTRTTDSRGEVTEKFSTKGNSTPRVVTITASVGNISSAPLKISVVAAPSSTPVLLLVASSDTLQTAPGAKVTLTALVKDSSNNVLPNTAVTMSADSGDLVFTNRTTDVNGLVTATLTSTADARLRTITVTAMAAGSVSPATKAIAVVSAEPTLTLTASSGTLASSGAPGNEVVLVALVRDANNAVVKDETVEFSADSGVLSVTDRTTDANGIVTEKLGTGGDPTTRTIKVTATRGSKSASVLINVTGNKIIVNNPGAVNLGATAELTVSVVDSNNNPLVGRPISVTTALNGVAVKGGGAMVTNGAGQVVLVYSAAKGGNDTITVRSMGESTVTTMAVNSTNFFVTGVNAATQPISVTNVNTCQKIVVHSDVGGVPQAGTVTLSSSRGSVYSDASCQLPLLTPVTFTASGDGAAFVKATGPGQATLTAKVTSTGSTVTGLLEFVAPLTALAKISVQADPANIGANSDGGSNNQSTLRAVVRDGTSQNNLVKGAQVAFSILSDPSGGRLSSPSVVTTGSDGSVSISYIAGATQTAVDGVVIQAQIQGASSAAAQVRLTVARSPLTITAGTGAVVLSPTTALYKKDFAVLVTDALGNPVSGVTVTAAVRVRNYFKGFHIYDGVAKVWVPVYTLVPVPPATRGECRNEDVNSNGVLDPDEDFNNTGRLDPLIPISVTSTGVTGSDGTGSISFVYPQDRANWVEVDFTIRGSVTGTEGTYVGNMILPGAASDYIDQTRSPPGAVSPYGVNTTCTDTL